MLHGNLPFNSVSPLCSPSHVPTHFHLKPVCKEMLRINRVATCAHEHVPCSFTAEYFGLVNLGIVSVLQGYTSQDALNQCVVWDMVLLSFSSNALKVS